MPHLLLILILVMNVLAFLLMGIDKRRARQKRWRISERTLLIVPALMGALGGTAGMFLFRHKTKHMKFRIGLPVMLIIQLALLVCAKELL